MAVYPDATVDVAGRGVVRMPFRPPVTPRLVAILTKVLKGG
jgi:hypothetical protein